MLLVAQWVTCAHPNLTSPWPLPRLGHGLDRALQCGGVAGVVNEHIQSAFGGTVSRSSSGDRFVALEKEGGRENFHTLMHAHIFQVGIAGNKGGGPGIDGQGNELVIGGISAHGHLGRDLEVLHSLYDFDQMLQAARAPEMQIKFRVRNARFQLMPGVNMNPRTDALLRFTSKNSTLRLILEISQQGYINVSSFKFTDQVKIDRMGDSWRFSTKTKKFVSCARNRLSLSANWERLVRANCEAVWATLMRSRVSQI